MRYTTLLKDARGIRLASLHRARLAPEGDGVVGAFDRFAATAAPGVWGLLAREGRLEALARPGTALFDGIPCSFAVSPGAHLRGPLPKPPPGGPWDAVRRPGTEALLTDAAGREILESGRAAVVAWDGACWVAPPRDRPAVDSLALGAVRQALALREAPLAAGADLPLALLNAVAGACVPAVPGRRPPPQDAVEALRRALDRFGD